MSSNSLLVLYIYIYIYIFKICIVGEGWSPNWVHSARRPFIGLLCLPRVIVRMENLVEWIGRGNRSTRRKPAPAPLCLPQIPGSNPGRCGGKPAINRLSYYLILLVWQLYHVHLRAKVFPMRGGGNVSHFSCLLATSPHISKLTEHFSEEDEPLWVILLFSVIISLL
jgi:hypothetical protein